MGFIRNALGLVDDFIRPVVEPFGDFLNSATSKVGEWFNNATGANQMFDKEMEASNTAYQRAMNDMEAAGLNPSLIYGSGSSASASTPSGQKGGSVGLSIPTIDGLINSAANILNANTRHIVADRQNKHLDWKEKDALDRSSLEIYDSIGRLLNTSVKTVTRTKF